VSEPVWLFPELVIAFHDEQLREFGGPPGLRDPGMLESALGRPQNQWSYGETDLAALAAA
jgi:death-on-curing protein